MLVPERGEPTTKIGLLVGVAAEESIPTRGRTPGKIVYLAKRIFFDREFVPWNKVARSGPFNIRLKAKNDRAV
jgi:hypothetical protein